MTTESELDSVRQRMAQIQIDFSQVIENLKLELHNQQISHVEAMLAKQQQIVGLQSQLDTARAALTMMDEASKKLEKALSNEAKIKP